MINLMTTTALLVLSWLGSDRLEDVLRWHQSTVQSIRSVACDVEITWEFPERPERNQQRLGRYRRQNDVTMVTEFNPSETVYLCYRAGRCLSLDRTPERVGLRLVHPEDGITLFHVERGAGVLLNYPISKWYYPLPELAQQAKRVRIVRTEGDLVTLGMDFPCRVVQDSLWFTEVTLDKRVGGLVVRVVDRGGDRQGRRELRMMDFKESGDGLPFPTTVQTRMEVAGKTHLVVTMKLKDLRINEPIPASEFALDIPHGAWMSDNIRKTEYQVNDQGERISEEKPVTQFFMGDFGGGPRPPPQQASETEPASVWPYLWAASGGAMVVLIVLWLWQRWRG